MQYRDFGSTGEKVSALGFGCMRLPTNGSDRNINEDEAIKIIRHGIDEGVNYIDTAFFYHGGKSEGLVGKALLDGYREKVLLATKSPFAAFKIGFEFNKILKMQLKRLQTDHIDMYMLHAANLKAFKNSALKLDLISKMEKAKAEGKIRYIGFSFHDDYEAFEEILNAYHWDFCQIQLNYIDVNNQAGIKGLELAAKKGIAVIVMEPLLGGKLANPTENLIKALPQGVPPVQSALDFIWSRKEVSLLLSGMSNSEQVEQNLKYASESSIGKLSDEDLEKFIDAKKVFDTMAKVSCTKCSYCMPCPAGVEVPEIFSAYNKSAIDVNDAKKQYAKIKGSAELCVKCKKCEAVCPQKIEISKVLEEASDFLGK
ncbi:MAG: aldo/keto reductase [Oscillospiraceae bacterium]